MELSSRNQIKVTIKSIKLGNIMAEVVMSLPDGQEIVSAITRGSTERLGLKEGTSVTAVFKATEVMVGK